MPALKLSVDKLAKLAPPYIFLDTIKKDSCNRRSLLFGQIEKVLKFEAGSCPNTFFTEAENYLQKGYWLCGYFTYEFGYFLEDSFKDLRKKSKVPLAWLAVAKKPVEAEFRGKKEEESYYRAKNLRPNIGKNQYKEKIARIKKFLEEGLTYQTNYTFKINFDFEGDVFSLYQALRRIQPTSYAAFINAGQGNCFLSFSPELFIKINKNQAVTSPMKGTIERGRAKTEDKEKKKQFALSQKIKAENLMIVDLLRNDLGRIAQKVKVPKLFNIEKYQTLYQMTSTVEARLKEELGLGQIFASIFPGGSVTGAPKIKTMRIINELEKEPRGIYTGAIGYISPEKESCFNIAIRTIGLNKKKGELGIGGGIVYDSDSEAEYKEALLKADFFTKTKHSFKLLETILWDESKGFWLLDLHLGRLKKSCRYFSIPFYPEKIKKEFERKIKERRGQAKLRLLVSAAGDFTVSAQRLSKIKEPVKIEISSKRVNSGDIFLYHKTTKRKFYDRERGKARKKGFFDVIFLNEKGELTEGAITNIFLREKGKLYTPPLSCGLLPGVLRQYLLKEKKMVEKKLYPEDLRHAEKLYVGNSVRGLLQATNTNLGG